MSRRPVTNTGSFASGRPDEFFPALRVTGLQSHRCNSDFEELHERFLLSTKVNECGVDGVEIRTLNAPKTTRTIGGNETYENGAE